VTVAACDKGTKSSIAIEFGPRYQVKDSIRDISIADAHEATTRVQFEISDVMLLHGAHAHAPPMDVSDPE
jgi:hypothetical protein